MDDRQRLEAIVSVINKYLPPDGIPINDAMSEIISLVDPLPPPQPAQEPVAVDGLEKILYSFEKDGKFVMKSMIRNELFAEINLLLKKAKKAFAQPAQERPWVELTDEEMEDIRASFSGQFLETWEFAYKVQVATQAKLKDKNT